MSDICQIPEFCFGCLVCDNTRTCALVSYFRQHSSQHIQTCLWPHLHKCEAHLELWLLTFKTETDRQVGTRMCIGVLPSLFTAVYCIASLLRGSLNKLSSCLPVCVFCFNFMICGHRPLKFFKAVLLARFLKKMKAILIDPPLPEFRKTLLT